MRVPVAIGALVAALTIAALAGLLLTRDEQPQPPAPPPRTEIERVAGVIRLQAGAIASGRGEAACRYFSASARAELQRLILARAPDYPFDCAFAMSELAGRLPPSALRALRHPQLTAVRVNGTRAVARLELPPDLAALGRRLGVKIPIGKGVPLRRIGGQWRVDAVTL